MSTSSSASSTGWYSSSGIVNADNAIPPLTSSEQGWLIAITLSIGIPVMIASLVQLSLDRGWTCCGRYERRSYAAPLTRFLHFAWFLMAIAMPIATIAGQTDVSSLFINQALALAIGKLLTLID
jgi:hypothetical protein